MRWDTFAGSCPQIADVAAERFSADEVVILGTLRADGTPRLSPCEVDIAAGRLCFGMMWRSRKALDLQRDPRLVVHSVPIGRMNPGGDIKLTGLAVDERDPDVRAAYRAALFARIEWAPDEPEFHLFSLDVHEAVFIRFGDGGRLALRWDEAGGCRRIPHPDDPA
ncbi:MAG TPA: pyridoxamine 5'-phosphate oxidase family protein [Actinomycetota bacterium]